MILSDGPGEVEIEGPGSVILGDPVRIVNRQGHWRFVGLLLMAHRWSVVVIGPYTNARNPKCPTERIFPLEDVRPASRGVKRDYVAMPKDLKALSDQAKTARRTK